MTDPCSCDEALTLQEQLKLVRRELAVLREAARLAAEPERRVNEVLGRMAAKGWTVQVERYFDGEKWLASCDNMLSRDKAVHAASGSTPLEALAQLTQAWVAENEP